MTAQKDEFSVPQYHIELVRDRSIPFIKLGGKEDIYQVMHTLLDKSVVEQMVVTHVSASNEIVGVEVIAIGQMTRVTIGMTEVFRGAIVAGVDSIYLCHNHPAGDPTPSPQDLSLTSTVLKAAEYLGILLLDHVIVSPNGTHHSIMENIHTHAEEMIKRQMSDIIKKGNSFPTYAPKPMAPSDFLDLDMNQLIQKMKKVF